MDPLTSLGLVGNVIQVITFASSLGIETHRLVKSGNQALPENEWLESQAQRLQTLTRELSSFSASAQDGSNAQANVLGLAKSCRVEASALIDLLKNLKVPTRQDGTKSKQLSFRKVVQSKLRTGDIETSRKKLESLENQLRTAVILSIQKAQSEEFQTIKTILSQNGVQRKINDETLQRLENEISAVSAALLLAQIQRLATSIIGILDYSQRTFREDTIEERHYTTFNWVLRDGPFKDWLYGSEDLFWICGHPGSGKSTLVKYLAQNLPAADSLQLAARKVQPLVAKHFFWVTGNSMQSSILGMLRNLLLQLLSALSCLPEIAPLKFWKLIQGGERQPVVAWTREKHLQTFESINSLANLQIFLLIDGLDECEERDHYELLRIIKQLAALDKIRICISSRPWSVFEREFRLLTPQLLLQNLTVNDMYQYTCDRLISADSTLELIGWDWKRDEDSEDLISIRQNQAKELVRSIVKKADGVFFWVTLVLDTICVRLSDGQSIPQLQRFVREFPPKLEDYFEKLVYERIAHTYRSATYSETAMALRMALLCADMDAEHSDRRYRSTGHNMSFVYFWLLRENSLEETGITVDPHFGTNAKFRAFSDEERAQMVKNTEKYLTSCCKDFLHIPQYDFATAPGPDNVVVAFRHRTAYDFLLTQRMQDLINSHVPPHFLNEDSWWIQITLCRFKIEHDNLSAIFHKILGLAERYPSLHSRLHGRKAPFDVVGPGFEKFYLHWIDVLIDSHHRRDALHVCPHAKPWDATATLIIFIQSGCHRLVTRTIKTVLSLPFDHIFNHQSVLAVACGIDPYEYALENVQIHTVSLLLEHGSDPNGSPEGHGNWSTYRLGASVWQRLLLCMWNRRDTGQNVSFCTNPINRRKAITDELRVRFDLTKLMIEHGAAVDFQVCVLDEECHHYQHDDYCTSSGCLGHQQHSFMSVLDILRATLTPDGFDEIQILIAKPSTLEAREKLKKAREEQSTTETSQMSNGTVSELFRPFEGRMDDVSVGTISIYAVADEPAVVEELSQPW